MLTSGIPAAPPPPPPDPPTIPTLPRIADRPDDWTKDPDDAQQWEFNVIYSSRISRTPYLLPRGWEPFAIGNHTGDIFIRRRVR